jgi:hypothetical protein
LRAAVSRAELVNPVRRLPDLMLPALTDGTTMRLLPGDGPVACVLVHHPGCAACRLFLARLADRAFGASDRVRAVAAFDAAHELADGTGLPILLDRAHEVARAVGLEAPAWLVADAWGAILADGRAGDGHGWPDAAAIVEWLEWARSRCPECEGEAF